MIEIKLMSNFGKYNNPIYNIGDENLEFKLLNPDINGAEIRFIADNGFTKKIGVINNNQFTLERKFIKIGKLSIRIEFYMVGEKIKEYRVEDLIIKDIDRTIKAIPEIEKLNNEVAKLTKIVNKLKKDLETTDKLISVLYHTNMEGLND